MFKRFVVSGTNKDNILTGTDRLDIMFGKKGDDVIEGGGGWDFLFGGKGNDKLFGGDGNDWLFGGKGKDELFGGKGDDKLFGGKGNDFLDGGAGSDYVFGDKGNDTFNFTLSENGGAKDYYDGGKGFDTLQLSLTSAEYDAAKAEIEEFEALLADGVKDFDFVSFGLSVRNFEKLEVVTVGGENTAPVAQSASHVLNEDNSISFKLLATDAEDDAVTLAIVTGPTEGTLTLNDDGTYEYRPNVNFFGDDSFTFKANDGTVDSNVATISLAINPVNDSPMVGRVDNVTVTADVVMPDPIRVLVLGREDGLNTTTHVEAVDQLDPLKFDAHWRLITDDVVWADELSTYNVVVLGDSGYFDFSDAATATELFSALNTFVTSSGKGVVTTGWFAQALPKITDPVAHGLADSITPIASALNHDYAGTGGPDPDVISIVADHEITAGVSDPFSLTTKFGWELAGGDINDGPTAMIDAGATLLATGIASNQDRNQVGEELPAIVYNDAVGMGRTAYLGGFYLSSTDFNPTPAHNDPVQDGLFERAIAWAAGGMGSATATATIGDALLLADATDVETPDDLFIDFVALQNANGASIELNAAGDIVYTPSADGLAALLEGDSISDSFDYRVSDGDDVSAIASISLTVDSPLLG